VSSEARRSTCRDRSARAREAPVTSWPHVYTSTSLESASCVGVLSSSPVPPSKATSFSSPRPQIGHRAVRASRPGSSPGGMFSSFPSRVAVKPPWNRRLGSAVSTAPLPASPDAVGAGASPTWMSRGNRSVIPRSSNGSVPLPSLLPGPTCGSRRIRLVTSRRRGPTPRAGGSTCTTSGGASGGTGRSSTRCTTSRGRFRSSAAEWSRIWGTRGSPGSACLRARCGCSIWGSSASVRRVMRPETARSAWPRCARSTSRWQVTRFCSTTRPRGESHGSR